MVTITHLIKGNFTICLSINTTDLILKLTAYFKLDFKSFFGVSIIDAYYKLLHKYFMIIESTGSRFGMIASLNDYPKIVISFNKSSRLI